MPFAPLKNQSEENKSDIVSVDKNLSTDQSDLLAMVTHQLRTPLVGTKWSLNLLLEGSLGPLNDAQKNILAQAYNTNERTLSLVGQILHVHKLESGGYRLRSDKADIIDLVDEIISEIQPNLEEKKIEINAIAEKEIAPFFMDPEKVEAVIQSLLENAVRYTPEGGKIDVGLDEKDGEVIVSVKDDGIGIPEEARKNIFQKFFRAPNAKRIESNGGSGLGLYIARGIVEKHGGKIWFKSKLNKGTTFYFSLPAKR